MTLSPGMRLGVYEIASPLGAGGMGEVYLATDTRLRRDVAIKVLPEELAQDKERLTRFEREARLLASLNHSNIATLYGFERQGTIQFLVMELVGGESLKERLAKGTPPLEEVLEMAEQIAEGLEAAHERGIIHRDLKPGNIMLTAEGKVKLLDFGLAKAMEGEGGVASDTTLSPTLTAAATQRGEVMGTLYYMSPEQARGKPVDRRTDIWAFGCVLYECLTGRMAFEGETTSDTIALILQREADMKALPGDLPPRITELLNRCFEKDPRKRLRDIGEARLEIEKVRQGNLAPTLQSGAVPLAPPDLVGERGLRRSPAATALLLVAGVVLGAVGSYLALRGEAGRSDPMVRFEILPPEGVVMNMARISPDGATVMYIGASSIDDDAELAATQERSHLYRRRLDELASTRLDDTEGVQWFAFSPDSRWVAWLGPTSPGVSSWNLKKAPLDGSAPPLILAPWSASWQDPFLWPEPDHVLVSLEGRSEVIRIPVDGSGPGEPVLVSDSEPGHHLPLDAWSGTPGKVLAHRESYAGGRWHHIPHLIDSSTGEARKIIDEGSSLRYSDKTGHLVFTRDETLFGMAVLPGTLEPAGSPVPIQDGLGVESASAGAGIDLSRNGTLLYWEGGRPGLKRSLIIIGEGGAIIPWSQERMAYRTSPVWSPRMDRVAVTIMEDSLLFSVWIADADRPRFRRLAAMPELDCWQPTWHPDGETVFYSCVGGGDKVGIYRIPADGSSGPQRIVEPAAHDRFIVNKAIDPTGRWLITQTGPRWSPSTRLLLLDLVSTDEPALRVLDETLKGAWDASFSPDGRWVSYVTFAAGRPEVQVRALNDDGTVGPASLVTTGRFGRPRWSETGRQGVFDMEYVSLTEPKSYIVTVDTTAGGRISRPRDGRIFPPEKEGRLEDLSYLPDGRVAALQRGEDEDIRRGAVVVTNWYNELERLMAASSR